MLANVSKLKTNIAVCHSAVFSLFQFTYKPRKKLNQNTLGMRVIIHYENKRVLHDLQQDSFIVSVKALTHPVHSYPRRLNQVQMALI